jgi:hypothetical protein
MPVITRQSDIIFYSPIKNRFSEELRKLIEESLKDRATVRVCKDIKNLSQCFREAPVNIGGIVLLTPTRGHLDEILTCRELLFDKRLILILPDSYLQSVSKGYTLRPHFLSFMDHNPEEIASVAVKMFQEQEQDYKPDEKE